MATIGYGYRRVSEEGFLSFSKDLANDAWAHVTVDAPLLSKRPSTSPLAALATDVRLKLRVTWAINDLADALGNDGQTVVLADKDWDSCQRRLDLLTSLSLESKEAAVREAALRVRAALLTNDGIGHTKWKTGKEVEFGRKQVLLAGRDPLKKDIALLKLGELLHEIQATTEVLAEANNHGGADGPTQARSAKIRAATVECVAAFNAARDELDWLIERQAPSKERDRLTALRAPFEILLDRYPAQAPAERAAPQGPPAAETRPPAEAPAEAPAEGTAAVTPKPAVDPKPVA